MWSAGAACVFGTLSQHISWQTTCLCTFLSACFPEIHGRISLFLIAVAWVHCASVRPIIVSIVRQAAGITLDNWNNMVFSLGANSISLINGSCRPTRTTMYVAMFRWLEYEQECRRRKDEISRSVTEDFNKWAFPDYHIRISSLFRSISTRCEKQNDYTDVNRTSSDVVALYVHRGYVSSEQYICIDVMGAYLNVLVYHQDKYWRVTCGMMHMSQTGCGKLWRTKYGKYVFEERRSAFWRGKHDLRLSGLSKSRNETVPLGHWNSSETGIWYIWVRKPRLSPLDWAFLFGPFNVKDSHGDCFEWLLIERLPKKSYHQLRWNVDQIVYMFERYSNGVNVIPYKNHKT